MKYLIFYDNTGKIFYSINVDKAPSGLEKFTFDVPANARIIGIDLTNPDNPKPITEKPKTTPSTTVNYSEEIENLQAAITELYELILGE